jgi:redox-sensitive bicupin YhaK (pirin superfamily)
MSAGTGISHSEYNTSKTEPVHFLQIWIIPDQTGLKPGYEQQAISFDKNRGRWELLASRAGRDASLTVHQDVDLWATRLAPGEQATFGLRPSRHAFAQVTRGAVTLNGVALGAGDGAAATQEEILEFKAVDGAETLLFDLV